MEPIIGADFRRRIGIAFTLLEDRTSTWGAVRWFARQCSVNETTVWSWLRESRAPQRAVKELESLLAQARKTAAKRHREEQAKADRKLQEAEVVLG